MVYGMKKLLSKCNNHYLFECGEGKIMVTTDPKGEEFNVNEYGTKQEIIDELTRWKNEVDQDNGFMLEVENTFIKILQSMEKIKQLKLDIEIQRNKNIDIYNSVPTASKEDPRNDKAEPILEQWREGATLLKSMISELRELELNLKQNEPKQQDVKKFVNSYGEATTRDITSSSYKRRQKKISKEIMSFVR